MMLPWHEPQWRIIHDSEAQDRMPHALLLTGPEGLGKGIFAQQLAQRMLCQSPIPQGGACGQCRTCLLFEAGSHPDFKAVHIPEDKKSITVDQVREVGNYFSLKSQYGLAKVVVVEPADAMNINASNSLLKTLEEPTPGALLMLVSSRPTRLSATIRSRCQEIRFSRGNDAGARQWLEAHVDSDADSSLLLSLTDGAPLKARDMYEAGGLALRSRLLTDLEALVEGRQGPLTMAKQWSGDDVAAGLYWLQSWILDMMRLKAAANVPFVANGDITQRLNELAVPLSLRRMAAMADKLSDSRSSIERNLNAQLVLEDVLIYWQACYRSA